MTQPTMRSLTDILADPLKGTSKPLPSDEEINEFIDEMCSAIGQNRSIHEIKILVIFLLRKSLRGIGESTTTRRELIQHAAILMMEVEKNYTSLLMELLTERP